MNKLKISSFNIRESNFCKNDKCYRVVDIIEAAKDLEAFDLPLCGLDIGVRPWGDMTIKNFIYHMARIERASMDHPVILDDEGYICDGWHRVSKAILAGEKTIKAKRLTFMPEPI